jgi:hypothetical protein
MNGQIVCYQGVIDSILSESQALVPCPAIQLGDLIGASAKSATIQASMQWQLFR